MKTSKLIAYTIAVAVVVIAGILTWRLTAPKPESAATQQTASAAPATEVATPASATSQPGATPQSGPAGDQSGKNAEDEESPASANSTSGQNSQVLINGRALTAEQLQTLEAQYRTGIPPGRYWYDSRSGFWGQEGYAVAGYSQPGIDFGQLSPNASHGTSGVFVNGRQLNQAEAIFFARIFGSYQQGRFWLDGLTGYVGYEGDPTARDNLFARIRQSQGGSQALSRGGMVGISNGGCTMVTTDTGYNASTPGCD